MAKHITQETFDDVVKENINEFDMSIQDALDDAVQQLESQGVNLVNIIKDVNLFSSEGDSREHPVVAAIKKIQNVVDQENGELEDLTKHLNELKIECDIDLSHRVLAEKNGGYIALKSALMKFKSNADMLSSVLVSSLAFTDGQPDVLDDDVATILLDLLEQYSDNVDILIMVVKLIRFTCTKHEGNRQMYVDKGLIEKLSSILSKQKSSGSVIKEVCVALRALTLDDDVRVPFGKAHENAKMIVTEGNALQMLLDLCKEHESDMSVLRELFMTLTKLVVRDEFCKAVMDMGGLEFILNAFKQSINDKVIVRQAIGVIKALAGNDNVKIQVMNAGGGEMILAAMTTHQGNPGIAEMGCATIATLVLRNPSHCTKIMEAHGHQVIVQAMKVHRSSEMTQKQGCMALRNLVVRSREYCDQILEQGAEDLINYARSTFKSCNDEAKAALRDLGCNVDLKCLWKGEKGSLAHD